MNQAVQEKISKEKINALKRLVVASPDVKTDAAKRFILWMIDQTKDFSKQVKVRFGHNNPKSLAEEVAIGIHDMISTLGSTNLRGFLELNDIGTIFGSCCDKSQGGWAVWIAETNYPRIEFLIPNFEMGLEIGQINVEEFR